MHYWRARICTATLPLAQMLDPGPGWWLLPNFGLVNYCATQRDLWSVPDSFMTTLDASSMLTLQAAFPNSRRDYWSVPDSFVTTLNASARSMLTLFRAFSELSEGSSAHGGFPAAAPTVTPVARLPVRFVLALVKL